MATRETHASFHELLGAEPDVLVGPMTDPYWRTLPSPTPRYLNAVRSPRSMNGPGSQASCRSRRHDVMIDDPQAWA